MGWQRSDPGNGPVVVTSGELVAEVKVGQVTKSRNWCRVSRVEARVVVTAVHIQRAVLRLVEGVAAIKAGEDEGCVDVAAPASQVQLHRTRNDHGPVSAAHIEQVSKIAWLQGRASLRVVRSVVVVELGHRWWEGSTSCIA